MTGEVFLPSVSADLLPELFQTRQEEKGDFNSIETRVSLSLSFRKSLNILAPSPSSRTNESLCLAKSPRRKSIEFILSLVAVGASLRTFSGDSNRCGARGFDDCDPVRKIWNTHRNRNLHGESSIKLMQPRSSVAFESNLCFLNLCFPDSAVTF